MEEQYHKIQKSLFTQVLNKNNPLFTTIYQL